MRACSSVQVLLLVFTLHRTDLHSCRLSHRLSFSPVTGRGPPGSGQRRSWNWEPAAVTDSQWQAGLRHAEIGADRRIGASSQLTGWSWPHGQIYQFWSSCAVPSDRLHVALATRWRQRIHTDSEGAAPACCTYAAARPACLGPADPGRCRGTRNCRFRSSYVCCSVAQQRSMAVLSQASRRDPDDRGGRAGFVYVADTLARIQGHRGEPGEVRFDEAKVGRDESRKPSAGLSRERALPSPGGIHDHRDPQVPLAGELTMFYDRRQARTCRHVGTASVRDGLA